jgi:molecular chaperone DnaJ
VTGSVFFFHESVYAEAGMSKDYYKILGVAKEAPEDEVKRAFRKLAQTHHPDKGGDPERFKEINEAYQVLSNKDKRQQYDQYGSTFEQARQQGGFRGFEGFGDFSSWAEATGVNFEDLFSGVFGGGLGDIFGGGSRGGARRQKRGRDLEVALQLSFKEAVFGVKKAIHLERRVACSSCEGSGAAKGSDLETCGACGGAGRVRSVQQTVFGAFQSVTTCEPCGGAGKKPSKQCERCQGRGTELKTDEITIDIPSGVDEGTTLEVREGGEAAGHGAPSGSLYVHVRVEASSEFTRDGTMIRSRTAISATSAALGDRVTVETVDGNVEVKIPAGTQPGDQLRLRSKGVPKRHGIGRGDHIVHIDVRIPEKLSRKEKQAWQQLRDVESS